MIRLLALDLDGTLLNSAGKISAANRNAIAAAEAAGTIVTIATGRRLRDARPVGTELSLNGPLITHNGALLKYSDSLLTVDYSLIDGRLACEIVRFGKSLGGDPLVSVDPHGGGSLLYDRISDVNIPLRRYVEWSQRLHGDAAEHAVVQVTDLEGIVGDSEVIHISFSGTCDAMKILQSRLESELREKVNVLATIYPHLDFTLLDILPPDASKGSGLKKLAMLNGHEPSEIMAIGDNFNDLEMLAFAGVPVVMGNADPRLLETPEFYTTVSNDEGGVAAAIERFILDQEKP